MYYPIAGNIRSVDPQIAQSEGEMLLSINCFEGLVYVDSTGAIANSLCTKYDISADGLVYTFYLREDAKWLLPKISKNFLGDKLPEVFDDRVTAHDFVFAFQRAVSSELKADDSLRLSAILNAKDVMSGFISNSELGVKAISDFVLEIRLSRAQPDFIYALTYPICMPCNKVFFEACGGRYGLSLEYLIFNGPFYFVRWKEDQSLRMNRNPNYAGNRTPEPDSVYLYRNQNENQVVENLEKGDLKAAYINENQLGKLKNQSDYKITGYENKLWSYIFNCGNEKLSNANIRKAFFLSADNSVFSEKKRAIRLIPPYCKGDTAKAFTSEYPYEYNETEARRYLEEGYSLLATDRITVNLIALKEYSQQMKAQLQVWQKALGVSVTVNLSEVETFEELSEAVKSGKYEMAFYPVEAAERDITEYLSIFTEDSNNNIFSYSDEIYTGNYKSMLNLSDAYEKSSACSKLEKVLLDAAVFYPVFVSNNYLVLRKEIKGLYFFSSKENMYFNEADYFE